MGENILFIPPIPQYGVIIEDPRQAGRSIFEPAYRCAADNVMKIIRSSRLYDQQKGQKIQNAAREEFLNTIVAFTGARGSGKSSAMLSFAKMLKESTLDFWKTEDKVRKTDYAIIRDSSFWVMSALDSTKMGKGEQLLASVAARMFKEYQKHLNEGKIPHTVTVEQKREFLTQIQKVTRESIMDGRDKKEEDESILLQNTVEQIDARSNVEKLVEIFLKMMFDKSEDAYLVILIDDLDMNLSDSYGIVDDIRKHLTIPHVIVLTSICIDQFRELAGIHYGKLFHEKRERCSTGDVMAQKYVEKMFPVSRQVEMPKYSLEQQQRTLIGNLIGEKTEKDPEEPTKRTEIGLNREPGLPDSLNIIDGVLHLIYRKTMLLLVPDENGRHWIVPNNLRELCNLIYFLQGMKDVAFRPKSDEDKAPAEARYVACGDGYFQPQKAGAGSSATDRLNTMENNLRRLMQYIVSDLLDYSTDGMSDDAVQMAKALSKLIRELPDWPLTEMNKKIVRDILSCMTTDNAYRLFFPKDLRESLLEATMHTNLISMGDVQHVLGAVSRRTNLETIKRLTEYVQMIWSIRMTIEFFCVGVRYSEDGMHGSIYENSSTYITRDFRDTVGGLMFSPDVGMQFLKYSPTKNDEFGVDRNWLMLCVGNNKIHRKSCNSLELMTVFSDVEMPKKSLLVKEEVTSVTSDWRTFMHGPYYQIIKDDWSSSEIMLYLDYFAIFTNLLSPATQHIFENDFSRQKRMDVYLAWVKKYVMAFPFYSMDWTNRFYAELVWSIQRSAHRNTSVLTGAVSMLNEEIKGALTQMEAVTKTYIAQTTSLESLTGNDYISRFISITLPSEGCIGDLLINGLRRVFDKIEFDKNRPMSSFVMILTYEMNSWSSKDKDRKTSAFEWVYDKLTSDDSLIPKDSLDTLIDILRNTNQNGKYDSQKSISACKQLIKDVINAIKETSAYKKELQTPPSENPQS